MEHGINHISPSTVMSAHNSVTSVRVIDEEILPPGCVVEGEMEDKEEMGEKVTPTTTSPTPSVHYSHSTPIPSIRSISLDASPRSVRNCSSSPSPSKMSVIMAIPPSTSAHQLQRISSPSPSLPAVLTPKSTAGVAPVVHVTTIDESAVVSRPASGESAGKPLHDWNASLTRMPLPPPRSLSVTSSLSFSGDMCRICHCEATPDSIPISPCHCTGTLRYVHQKCLQLWIKSSGTKSCEVCRYIFIMHSRVKPICKWESLSMSSMERRRLLCSATFHVFAITCIIWSLFVLIDRMVHEALDDEIAWAFWTKFVIVMVGAIGGLVFLIVQCRSYGRLFGRWRAYNRIVYVQNCPDLKPRSAQRVIIASSAPAKNKKKSEKVGNHRRVAAAS